MEESPMAYDGCTFYETDRYYPRCGMCGSRKAVFAVNPELDHEVDQFCGCSACPGFALSPFIADTISVQKLRASKPKPITKEEFIQRIRYYID